MKILDLMLSLYNNSLAEPLWNLSPGETEISILDKLGQLLAEVCRQYLGPVLTKREEFDNDGFTLKTHQLLSIRTTSEKLSKRSAILDSR